MKVQGFILIDVDAAALNNAGIVSRAGIENSVETKKIRKEGCVYPYVSGQAWRYWWRTTLQKDFGWTLSPIIKLENQNQIYTEANPFKYPDDDMFGYMKAPKKEKKGKKDEDNKDEENNNDTTTRISPLKNSALISVGKVQIANNFSSMSRQNDFPVIYGKEEYSATMKGMFSIDIDQVGTFASYNKTGFKNLNDKLKLEIKSECTEVEDQFVSDKNGRKEILLRMDGKERKKRILDVLKALKTISGGAMQTNNMVDVTPKFIVLALTRSGNHPFSHIISSDPVNHEQSIFRVPDFKEVLKEYEHEFIGDVFIGKRGGFWNEYYENINELNNYMFSEKNDDKEAQFVRFYPVNEAIDMFCDKMEQLIK